MLPSPSGVQGRPACPLCGSPSRRRFAIHGIWLRDCDACGHRFADYAPSADHVARVYGNAYFEGGGAGYADYIAEGSALRARGRWYARLVERWTRPGDVLDVGCAAGFFLRGFVDAGWTGHGVEPNPAMAEHARTQLGLDVRTGTLEDLQVTERYDLVTLVQVVAHLVDPRRALTAAAAALKPSGLLLVETWDRRSWTARILGRRWHEYSPPSVLHWFSRRGLSDLGRAVGLRHEAEGRPRLKRIGADHARSLVTYKYGGSRAGRAALAALAAFPSAWTLPYPADDLFWMVFRRGPRPVLPSPVTRNPAGKG
jgi:SAM-dependent methyltransferase